jgi:hypothetical protein
MSIRHAAPLALVLLAACDGNPFVDPPVDEGDPDPETGTSALYGTEIEEELTMNNLDYDEANDELIVNNIPFDGTSAANGQARYVNVGGLGASAFARYESIETAETGRRQYYAVFRRSDSGFAQAAAIATDEYISFGFGGVTAQRSTASISVPGQGEYVYTGEYAAVRAFDESQEGAPGGVQYVTGNVQLDVDVADFDVTGAVEGIISNRTLFDEDGNQIGTLGDFVSLATAEIDFDLDQITQSTAVAFSPADGETIATGNWAGIFAGPNGQEIAGIVILEGTVTADDASGTYRETGVFTAVD